MPKVFTSETQKIGEIGENIAVKFLVKHGFSILDRNYTKKWGELDIVAEKKNKLHFIEVKSVSRITLDTYIPKSYNDSDERYQHRPEDNMHPWKLKRLQRAIQTYILEKRFDNREWQFDLACVFLDQEKRVAKVRFMDNIIL